MLKYFRIGGIHPPDHKITQGAPITPMPLPARVVISLAQHIGAPAEVMVAKGDRVKVGQLIGRPSGFLSAAVHASVSGEVASIEPMADGAGVLRPAVTIDVEGDVWEESIDRSESLQVKCDLTPSEMLHRIAAAGVVGMGGATFPTQVKLTLPPDKKVECLIINGAECEPYLTADHSLMLEQGEKLLAGVKILAQILDVQQTYIAIENNKPDAITHLRSLCTTDPGIEVVSLKPRYPQGGEKQLVDALLRRQVPSAGLPLDVGVMVQNVGTAFAVYEAVMKNKPLIERVVTLSGESLAQPANVKVRIGTPIEELINFCGGLPDSVEKVVAGGPMMGRALSNLQSGVTKGTSGVLLIDRQSARRTQPMGCIKCSKCLEVCPMALEPYLLSKLSQLNLIEDTLPLKITDCIECGSCAYICPSALPLLDYIRLGKSAVIRLQRARKA